MDCQWRVHCAQQGGKREASQGQSEARKGESRPRTIMCLRLRVRRSGGRRVFVSIFPPALIYIFFGMRGHIDGTSVAFSRQECKQWQG